MKKKIYQAAISSLLFILTILGMCTGVYATENSGGNESGQIRGLQVLSDSATYSFPSGTGTKEDPYRITSAADLVELSSQVSAGNNMTGIYFKQTAPIDLSGIADFIPIGKNATTMFKGNYDGGCYPIKNLTEVTAGYGGLFGYVVDASIRNVILEGGSITGKYSTGGIAGRWDGKAVLENCANKGCTIQNGGMAGGLIGMMTGATSVTIESCYNQASVKGTEAAGGIIGRVNGGTISHCYSTGNISCTVEGVDEQGEYVVGGISGACGTNASVTACYYNSEAEYSYGDGQQGNNHYGYAKTTAQMKSFITAELGDAYLLRNGAYPVLRGECGKADFAGGTGTASDPYLVATPEQLAMVNQYVGISDVHFQQTAELDLSGYGEFPTIANGRNAEFMGHYDGGGYPIRHATITSDAYGGLFGSVNGAVLEDIYLVGCNVTGAWSTGGLVGKVTDSDLTRCALIDTTVTCLVTTNLGGIAGYLVGGADLGSRIISCYNRGGTISGKNTAGGIIGYCGNNNSIIKGCYYTGTLSIVEEAVTDNNGQITIGAILGSKTGVSTITSCYYDTEAVTYLQNGQKLEKGNHYGTGKSTLEMKSPEICTALGNDYGYRPNEYPDFTNGTNGMEFQGSGTQGDPYLIYHADQLNQVRNYLGNPDIFFKQMADLDLSGYQPFTPIGSSQSAFMGHYDGGGYGIQNLRVEFTQNYAGLFGCTEGAVIENVRLVSGSVYGTNYSVGGLVGRMTDGMIQNCANEGVTVKSGAADKNAGGIVGMSNSTVTNCYNWADVRGGNAGGISGYMRATNPSTISNCYNAGNITAVSAAGEFTCGPVAVNGSAANTIQNCYYDKESAVYQHPSGQYPTDNGIGKTTAEMKTAQMASELGDAFSYIDGTYPVLKVRKSVFAGGSGTSEAPFLVATAQQLDAVRGYLNQEVCFKQIGDIDMSGFANFIPIGNRNDDTGYAEGFTGVYDGGGYEIKNLSIDITNEIAETTGVYGGLFGWVSGGTIKNLGVSGSIKTSASCGGVAGRVNSGNFYNCYNKCLVETSINGGGIAGWVNSGPTTIQNCYNLGSIKGGKSGGIVGYFSITGLTLENCYNAGNITSVSAISDGTNCIGGIAGDFNEKVIPTNCYYDMETIIYTDKNGVVAPQDLPAYGEGKTTAVMKSLELAQKLGSAYMYVKDSYPPFNTGLVYTVEAPTLTVSTTNWSKEPITMTLKGGEAPTAGKQILQYSTDGQNWLEYEGSLTIDAEGTTTLYGRAVNKEMPTVTAPSSPESVTVRIDRTAPVTADSITADVTENTNGKVTLTLSGISDSPSGVSKAAVTANSTYPTSWAEFTGSKYQYEATKNGTYYFWIQDAAGNWTRKYYSVKNIMEKTGGISFAETAEMSVGKTLELNYQYTGNPKNISISGDKLSTAVLDTANNKVTITAGSKPGNSTVTLTFTDYDGTVTEKKCIVTLKDIVPKITADTAFTSNPLSVGKMTQASVTATGTNLVYQWYWSNQAEGGTSNKVDNGTAATLQLSNVQTDLNGRYYWCQVSNGSGTVNSKRVLLVVRSAPGKPGLTLSRNGWSGGWAPGALTVTMTEGTAPSAGGQKLQYKIGEAGTWTDYKNAVVIDAEGETVIYGRAVNAADPTLTALSNPASVTAQIDTSAPQGSIKIGETAVDQSNWLGKIVYELFYKEKKAVVIQASDTLSQIPKGGVEYLCLTAQQDYLTVSELDKRTDWKVYDAGVLGFDIVPNDTYVVYARITNGAGLNTYLASDGLLVDDTKPKAEAILSPPAGTWTKDSVAVTLQASDALAGVDSYSFDNGASYQTWGNTWADTEKVANTITVKTNTTLQAKVKDKAGNVADLTIKVENIDQTVPEATVAQTPTTMTNKAVTVTVTSDDKQSGLADTAYCWDKTNWVAENSKEFTENGSYQVKVRDAVGNEKTVEFTISNIDKVSPVIGSSPTIEPTWASMTENITISLPGETVTDNGEVSGVYLMDSASSVVETQAFTKVETQYRIVIENPGQTVSRWIRAKDTAGNWSDAVECTIQVDGIAPEIGSFLVEDNGTNFTVTFPVDDWQDTGKTVRGSGVAGVWYVPAADKETEERWIPCQAGKEEGTYTFTEEAGEFYVYARDNTGNTTAGILVSDLDMEIHVTVPAKMMFAVVTSTNPALFAAPDYQFTNQSTKNGVTVSLQSFTDNDSGDIQMVPEGTSLTENSVTLYMKPAQQAGAFAGFATQDLSAQDALPTEVGILEKSGGANQGVVTLDAKIYDGYHQEQKLSYMEKYQLGFRFRVRKES